MKSNDFIQMVSQDIKKCDDVLLSGQGINPLLNELVGKYSKVSNNFPTIEMNPLLFRMHPNVPKENVQIIQGFLKAYLLNDCEDYRFDESKNTGINVITNITNTNENNVSIKSFPETKIEIENMTSLPDTEIEEILSKIDELENIVNSTDRKTKKWENAKDIIKWVADKGVDVGTALLPIILQIGQ